MSILSDRELRALNLVDNFDEKMLNPASLDVRIGPNVKVEEAFGRFVDKVIPEAGLIVEPGDFLLAQTLETVTIPNGYAAELRLKSTIARLGWNHAMAVWVDPGWNGVLTLEIKNDLQYNSLRLKIGMRFAQMIVHRTTTLSDTVYEGRYQDAKTVEEAKF